MTKTKTVFPFPEFLRKALILALCISVHTVKSISIKKTQLYQYNYDEIVKFRCNESTEVPYYGEWRIRASFDVSDQYECYSPMVKFNNGPEEDAYNRKDFGPLSNTYSGDVSTTDTIELLCRRYWGGEVLSRSFCFFNVTTTWKCSDYVEDSCELKSKNVNKAVAVNNEYEEIKYKFETELDDEYILCDCTDWKVVATGADGKVYGEKSLGCISWNFMKNTWEASIDLPPNNADNPSYTVAAHLVSTHVLRDGTKDESIKCDSINVVLSNPPTAPRPYYPKGETIYYRESQGFHPTFKWHEPVSWGWVPKGVKHEYIVEDIKSGDQVTIKRNEADIEYLWEDDFDQEIGTCTWRVGAKSSSEMDIVWSDPLTFKVCPVYSIDSFDLSYPSGNSILSTRDVSFSWNTFTGKIPSCANKSLYGYVFTLWKKSSGITVINETTPTNSFVAYDLDDDEYTWDVEAYGPAGIRSSSNGEKSFSICIDSPPSVPQNLRVYGGNKVMCISGKKVKVDILWDEPNDQGKLCTEVGSALGYMIKKDSDDLIPVGGNKYPLSLLCGKGNVSISVIACKGSKCGPTANTSFSICEQSLPDEPIVSDHEKSYFRKKTNVTWNHSGTWGTFCDSESVYTNVFNLKFSKAGANDVITSVDGEKSKKEYSTEVELTPGNWTLSIVASTKIAKSDEVLKSNEVTAIVTAAEFPAPISLVNESTKDSLTFMWNIDEDVVGHASDEGVTCTVFYIENGNDTINSFVFNNVSSNMSYTIDLASNQTQWWVELKNMKGESVNSTVVVHSAENFCLPINPQWAEGESALVQPKEGAVVFRDVTFEWKEPTNVGKSCKEEDSQLQSDVRSAVTTGSETDEKYYVVNVNGAQYTTSETQYSLSDITSGKNSWSVIFYNGNVNATTEKQSFCLADNPPQVKASCSEKIHKGLVLEWKSADFGETCGKSPKYVVVVNENAVDVDISQTSYTLSEAYANDEIEWSVRAVVGEREGPISPCGSVKVCLYKKINPVVFNSMEGVSKTGEWTFAWTNPNPIDGKCFVAAGFTYAFSLSDTHTGDVVCSKETSETSVGCSISASGLYRMSVVVSYGDMQAVEDKNVSLCIPAVVDPPNVTAPADGYVFLDGELVSIAWTGLTQKETQCKALVSHYVRYWADGDEENAITLRIEDADVDVKLSKLAKNTFYHWTLEEMCEHWDKNLTRSGTFWTCTPSEPPAPTLEGSGNGKTFREQFTLSWPAVNFSEVCEPRNKTGYHVYFFPAGSNYSSVPYSYVEKPEYTVSGATDGDYQYVVRAVNNGVLGDVSEAANVSVCTPTVPSSPVLLSPSNGVFVRVRDGINFDIVKENIKWKICDNETGTVGKYELCINGKACVEIPDDDTNATTSYDRAIYRFSRMAIDEYGYNEWYVKYTSRNGKSVKSSVSYFVSCNAPLAARSIFPENNATDLLPTVKFQWDIKDEDLGYRCTYALAEETPSVRLYVDLVNMTELMEAQNVTSPADVDLSAAVPSTLVSRHMIGETGEFEYKCDVLGGTYIWRTVTNNGFDSTESPTHFFTVTSDFCAITDCSNHGECVDGACVCEPDFGGTYCDYPIPKNKGSSALGPALGGSLGGVVLIAIILALILFLLMRKSGRKRVVLEGPGGDIRFSRVKVPAMAKFSSEETEAIEQRIREDCERLQNGMAPEDAFLFAQECRAKVRPDGIDETVKAVLYAYYKLGHGSDLVKYYIAKEVSSAQKPDTLFRQNTPAAVAFKFWSKIVGLDYLFACFSDVLKGIIQHEVDAARDKKSDVSLQLFNDTCEVDPSRITDDEGEDMDQLLAVNATQLSLTVQRFATQIYRSVIKQMPYELKDMCCHISETIEQQYPGYGVRGVSAFLFLRLYCVSITVPEAYGLLKEPPSADLRRTLVLAAKVLQVMSLGVGFDSKKEQFMKQFNLLVEENKERMAAFYATLLDRTKPCEEIKPDAKVPSGIYKDSLTLIAFMVNNEKAESSSSNNNSNEGNSETHAHVHKKKKYKSVEGEDGNENENGGDAEGEEK